MHEKEPTDGVAGLLTPFLGTSTSIDPEGMVYDAGNRLSSALCSGGFASTYYDDSGLRASRTRTDGSTVYYVYDESGMSGDIPVAEFDGYGDLLAANYVGPDGLPERSMLGDFWNTAAGDDPSDTPSDYFTYDPQGNTCQRLRSDYDLQPPVPPLGPWVLDTQEYDAYGDNCADADDVYQTQTQTKLASDYGYEGQFGYRTDQSAGLIQAGHRFYQPQTGRWLNRDPMGYDGGINLYEYSGDDPVNEEDPSGDQTADAGDEFLGYTTPHREAAIPAGAVRAFVAQPQRASSRSSRLLYLRLGRTRRRAC